jgi:hypothetical protein
MNAAAAAAAAVCCRLPAPPRTHSATSPQPS